MKHESAAMQLGFVYFALSSDGMVKIGCTNNVDKRLGQLRGVNLDLKWSIALPTWNKARALEQRLHRQLAQYRVYGEWFKVPADVLLKTYEDAKARPGPILGDKPLINLSREERIEQEHKWERAGFEAFFSKIAFKDYPRVGKSGSAVRGRAKQMWQIGWMRGWNNNRAD